MASFNFDFILQKGPKFYFPATKRACSIPLEKVNHDHPAGVDTAAGHRPPSSPPATHPARRRPPTKISVAGGLVSSQHSPSHPARRCQPPCSPPPATHGSRRPAPYLVTSVHWLDARPPAETPPLLGAALLGGRSCRPLAGVARVVLHGPRRRRPLAELTRAGPWSELTCAAPGRRSPASALLGGRPCRRRPSLLGHAALPGRRRGGGASALRAPAMEMRRRTLGGSFFPIYLFLLCGDRGGPLCRRKI
jgi:hypothetical protein